MMSLEELKSKAKLKGLGLGNLEKDYLLDLVLFSISRNTRDELIFKGGTCMYKFYGLGRFSEDVDFTAAKPIDIERLTESIISDLKQFGINCHVREKREPFSSVLVTLRCEGPLYNGTPQTYSNVRIDINNKSSIDMVPVLKNYSSIYPEIPSFSILAMQEAEIMAEKIRAIVTRNKARDLYDLWYLMAKGVNIDKNIIEKKLGYYKTEFDYEEFEKAVKEKEAVWERDLKPIIRNLPNFSEIQKVVLSEAKKCNSRKKQQDK